MNIHEEKKIIGKIINESGYQSSKAGILASFANSMANSYGADVEMFPKMKEEDLDNYFQDNYDIIKIAYPEYIDDYEALGSSQLNEVKSKDIEELAGLALQIVFEYPDWTDEHVSDMYKCGPGGKSYTMDDLYDATQHAQTLKNLGWAKAEKEMVKWVKENTLGAEQLNEGTLKLYLLKQDDGYLLKNMRNQSTASQDAAGITQTLRNLGATDAHYGDRGPDELVNAVGKMKPELIPIKVDSEKLRRAGISFKE